MDSTRGPFVAQLLTDFTTRNPVQTVRSPPPASYSFGKVTVAAQEWQFAASPGPVAGCLAGAPP